LPSRVAGPAEHATPRLSNLFQSGVVLLMRGRARRVLLLLLLVANAAATIEAQEIVDRIVARVENDIILLSDIRALSRYQQFLDGKSEADAQILDRLIDQWIVRTEADVSRFPHPTDAEIDRGIERQRKSFFSREEFEARKKQVGLNDAELRAIVASQLYLSNYLDSRFRPGVQIDPKTIDDFYEKSVVPQAKARGQEPPPLDAARDYIQEALVQRGINDQADQWLIESKARLHIEKLLEQAAK
jgi:peptidyl-prolyl cis-trans isomerase SurA